jgi:type II secretory pathway pseudopilin PulG
VSAEECSTVGAKPTCGKKGKKRELEPESMSKRHRRLVFIKGFILGCILFLLVIGSYYGTYRRVQEGQVLVTHRAIIRALKEHIASQKRLPTTLSELYLLESSEQNRIGSDLTWIPDQIEHRGLTYDPNAWEKAGRILLHSYTCGSYVVTFGDESQAVLSDYWDYDVGENEPNKSADQKVSFCLHGRGPLGVQLMVLSLAVLVICLAATLIVPRVLKVRN